MKLTPARVQKFRRTVWRCYALHGRDFAWRRTRDPYRIAVSEIMLQQTQAPRVEPKYRAFVRQFPNWRALARATPRSVLASWSGLGYNRRALALHALARQVQSDHGGVLPSDDAALQALPGIGPATAAAIRAFAFNEQSVYLDTNVRAVYLHEFFARRQRVLDAQVAPLVQQTFVRGRAREWYYALLDYGAWLKANHPNPTRRSAHYHRQSTFAGSNRQLRGRIVAILLVAGTLTEAQLVQQLAVSSDALDRTLVQLAREGFVRRRGRLVVVG